MKLFLSSVLLSLIAVGFVNSTISLQKFDFDANFNPVNFKISNDGSFVVAMLEYKFNNTEKIIAVMNHSSTNDYYILHGIPIENDFARTSIMHSYDISGDGNIIYICNPTKTQTSTIFNIDKYIYINNNFEYISRISISSNVTSSNDQLHFSIKTNYAGNILVFMTFNSIYIFDDGIQKFKTKINSFTYTVQKFNEAKISISTDGKAIKILLNVFYLNNPTQGDLFIDIGTQTNGIYFIISTNQILYSKDAYRAYTYEQLDNSTQFSFINPITKQLMKMPNIGPVAIFSVGTPYIHAINDINKPSFPIFDKANSKYYFFYQSRLYQYLNGDLTTTNIMSHGIICSSSILQSTITSNGDVFILNLEANQPTIYRFY